MLKTAEPRFLMTPAQHRAQAWILRHYDPEATAEEAAHAEALALHHENVARLIERRRKSV
jgi:hypothetical protein